MDLPKRRDPLAKTEHSSMAFENDSSASNFQFAASTNGMSLQSPATGFVKDSPADGFHKPPQKAFWIGSETTVPSPDQ